MRLRGSRTEWPGGRRDYSDILEAFAAEGCPVCSLVERDTRRALDALMYESVNDPKTRERIRRARGFCARHVEMLIENPSVLGLAIIGADLVGEAMARLEERPARWKQAPAPACPACERARQWETDTLTTLAAAAGNADLRAGYAASGGLCLPHLDRVLHLAAPADRAWIAETERQILDALRAHLREVIRKSDYRFQDEPAGEEAGSWRRALWKLAGRPTGE